MVCAQGSRWLWKDTYAFVPSGTERRQPLHSARGALRKGKSAWLSFVFQPSTPQALELIGNHWGWARNLEALGGGRIMAGQRFWVFASVWTQTIGLDSSSAFRRSRNARDMAGVAGFRPMCDGGLMNVMLAMGVPTTTDDRGYVLWLAQHWILVVVPAVCLTTFLIVWALRRLRDWTTSSRGSGGQPTTSPQVPEAPTRPNPPPFETHPQVKVHWRLRPQADPVS